MDTGRILCRFVNRTDEIKSLGKVLQTYVSGDFEPYFTIQEQGYLSDAVKFPLSDVVIHNMCIKGSFELGTIRFHSHRELSLIHISLCLQDTPYPGGDTSSLPISGFPRKLVSETRNPGEFLATSQGLDQTHSGKVAWSVKRRIWSGWGNCVLGIRNHED